MEVGLPRRFEPQTLTLRWMVELSFEAGLIGDQSQMNVSCSTRAKAEGCDSDEMSPHQRHNHESYRKYAHRSRVPLVQPVLGSSSVYIYFCSYDLPSWKRQRRAEQEEKSVAFLYYRYRAYYISNIVYCVHVPNLSINFPRIKKCGFFTYSLRLQLIIWRRWTFGIIHIISYVHYV